MTDKRKVHGNCKKCGNNCEMTSTLSDECCKCMGYPKSKYCDRCMDEHMVDLSAYEDRDD